MAPVTKNPLQDAVVRAVALRPGLGPSALGRLVGAGKSSVFEAISDLSRRGVLVDHGERRHPSYFLKGASAGHAHRLHGAPLRALNVVHETGGASLRALAMHAAVSLPEASRLAARLCGAGVAVKIMHDRSVYMLPT